MGTQKPGGGVTMDWDLIPLEEEIKERGSCPRCGEKFKLDEAQIVTCPKCLLEKFVIRDDFCQHVAWQNQQRIAEWNRLMEHSHGTNGEVVFPADDFHKLSPESILGSTIPLKTAYEFQMEHEAKRYQRAKEPERCQSPAINIVLKEDGQDSMFVEIETDNGESVNIGTRYDYDSFTRLRITASEIIAAWQASQPEQPVCDHPCHELKYSGFFFNDWKVCPMGCGKPLAGKEE
jgi:hypothetical protein